MQRRYGPDLDARMTMMYTRQFLGLFACFCRLLAAMRRVDLTCKAWTMVEGGLTLTIDGDFIQIDPAIEEVGLFRIGRKGDWRNVTDACEWHHFQVFPTKLGGNPAGSFPPIKEELFPLEMIMSHGPDAVTKLLTLHREVGEKETAKGDGPNGPNGRAVVWNGWEIHEMLDR